MDFSSSTLLPFHPKTGQGQIRVLKRSVLDHHRKFTQATLTIRSPKIKTPVYQERRIDNPIIHELGKRRYFFLRTLYCVSAGTKIGDSFSLGDERSTGFVAVLIPKFDFLHSPQIRSTYRLLIWLVFIHGQRCLMSNLKDLHRWINPQNLFWVS